MNTRSPILLTSFLLIASCHGNRPSQPTLSTIPVVVPSPAASTNITSPQAAPSSAAPSTTISAPCDGRLADIKSWYATELTRDLVLRCNGSQPVLVLRTSKEERAVTAEQWDRFWKGVDVTQWPTDKQCGSSSAAKPPGNLSVEYDIQFGSKEYSYVCRDTPRIPRIIGEIGGFVDTIVQATAPDDVKMFGSELDRIEPNRKPIRSAATQLAIIVAKNDAESFLAHVGDSVTVDGKRMTRDHVAARIKSQGVQAFARIQLMNVDPEFPYGIGWRLDYEFKNDSFGLCVGSGYGPNWLLRARVAKDGTWSVVGVTRKDLGAP